VSRSVARPAPLPASDAAGLLAAMMETPVLAWTVPADAFEPGPYRALHAFLVGASALLAYDAEACGSYERAIETVAERHRYRRGFGFYAHAAQTARRVIDGVRTLPELLGPGRALLADYARPHGLLVDEPAVVEAPEEHDPWLDEPSPTRRREVARAD